MSIEPFFHALSYSLGEMIALERAIGDDIDQAMVRLLKMNGLEHYRKARDIRYHIVESIKATLEQSGFAPDRIAAVMVASETTDPSSQALTRNDLLEILRECGIEGCSIIGSSYSACANTALALTQADALVRSGYFANCLVVSYYAQVEGVSRLMPPSIGFLSDGAAACLVSQDQGSGQTGFVINHAKFRSDLSLGSYENVSDYTQSFLKISQGISGLSEELATVSEKPMPEFGTVIMNNMCTSALKMFSLSLGVVDDAVFKDMISETSHVAACDILINLLEAQKKGVFESDPDALVFASGPTNWVFMNLTAKSS